MVGAWGLVDEGVVDGARPLPARDVLPLLGAIAVSSEAEEVSWLFFVLSSQSCS